MTRRAASLALLIAAWAAPAWGQATAEVYFSEPPNNAEVEGGPWITVSGLARGTSPQPPAAFDVMLILDTSGSTRNPSGLRVDQAGRFASGGTGVVGFRSLPAGSHSILAAEVAASMQFLDISDPATTRVGVITFSGAFQVQFLTGMPVGVPGSTNAWVECPLTTDYASVRRALLNILRRGPDGGTDMGAGLRLALRELLALPGGSSPPRPEARKVALLLTDGFPTLPFGSVDEMDPGDLEAVITAARVAAKGSAVIHTFCLGPEALSAPIACSETARITGGIFTPVRTPADIVNILPATPIGHVELVAVRNVTTGQMARSLSLSADGNFTAEIPLAPGTNRLVVELHGAQGLQGSAAVLVNYRAGDVTIEVNKERERQVEIQVEKPPPQEQRLDLKVEPPPARDRQLDLRIERPAPR